MREETTTTMNPCTTTVCGYCGKPLMNCVCGTTEGSEWIGPHLLDETGRI